LKASLISQLVICLIFLVTAKAATAADIAVFDVTGGKKTPINTAATHRAEWIKNADGVRAYSSVIKMALPFDVAGISAETESVTLKSKGRTILYRTLNMVDRFNIGEKTIEVQIKNPSKGVIDENCKAKLVKLELKSSAPFFVATSCEQVGDNLMLSLTIPAPVQIQKSSVFESKGKGESYRLYEIGNIKAASGAIAEFTFKLGDKIVNAQMVSLRKEQTDKKPKAGRIGIGLGYFMLKVQSSAVNASDSKPGVIVKVSPYPLFAGLNIGLSLESALALTENVNSVTYSQYQFFLGYNLVNSSKLDLAPRVYYVVSNHQHDLSRLGLKHNNVGGGLFASYTMSDRLLLQFEGLMSSFGSQAVKSHMAFDLSVIRARKSTQGTSWGVGAKMQSYSAKGLTTEPKFDQMIGYGIVIL
jgi:hypothetical protein